MGRARGTRPTRLPAGPARGPRAPYGRGSGGPLRARLPPAAHSRGSGGPVLLPCLHFFEALDRKKYNASIHVLFDTTSTRGVKFSVHRAVIGLDKTRCGGH